MFGRKFKKNVRKVVSTVLSFGLLMQPYFSKSVFADGDDQPPISYLDPVTWDGKTIEMPTQTDVSGTDVYYIDTPAKFLGFAKLFNGMARLKETSLQKLQGDYNNYKTATTTRKVKEASSKEMLEVANLEVDLLIKAVNEENVKAEWGKIANLENLVEKVSKRVDFLINKRPDSAQGTEDYYAKQNDDDFKDYVENITSLIGESGNQDIKDLANDVSSKLKDYNDEEVAIKNYSDTSAMGPSYIKDEWVARGLLEDAVECLEYGVGLEAETVLNLLQQSTGESRNVELKNLLQAIADVAKARLGKGEKTEKQAMASLMNAMVQSEEILRTTLGSAFPKIQKCTLQLTKSLDFNCEDAISSDIFPAIGTEENPFKGELSGLYEKNKIAKIESLKLESKTGQDIGLFGFVEGAKIHDLYIADDVVFKSEGGYCKAKDEMFFGNGSTEAAIKNGGNCGLVLCTKKSASENTESQELTELSNIENHASFISQGANGRFISMGLDEKNRVQTNNIEYSVDDSNFNHSIYLGMLHEQAFLCARGNKNERLGPNSDNREDDDDDLSDLSKFGYKGYPIDTLDKKIFITKQIYNDSGVPDLHTSTGNYASDDEAASDDENTSSTFFVLAYDGKMRVYSLNYNPNDGTEKGEASYPAYFGLSQIVCTIYDKKDNVVDVEYINDVEEVNHIQLKESVKPGYRIEVTGTIDERLSSSFSCDVVPGQIVYKEGNGIYTACVRLKTTENSSNPKGSYIRNFMVDFTKDADPPTSDAEMHSMLDGVDFKFLEGVRTCNAEMVGGTEALERIRPNDGEEWSTDCDDDNCKLHNFVRDGENLKKDDTSPKFENGKYNYCWNAKDFNDNREYFNFFKDMLYLDDIENVINKFSAEQMKAFCDGGNGGCVGMVAKSEGALSVTNCSSSGDLTAKGGEVGKGFDEYHLVDDYVSAKQGTIKYDFVAGTGGVAGGLVGYSSGKVEITKCQNSSKINVAGGGNIGVTTVNDVFSFTGGKGGAAGGLVGHLDKVTDADSIIIDSCQNSGPISTGKDDPSYGKDTGNYKTTGTSGNGGAAGGFLGVCYLPIELKGSALNTGKIISGAIAGGSTGGRCGTIRGEKDCNMLCTGGKVCGGNGGYAGGFFGWVLNRLNIDTDSDSSFSNQGEVCASGGDNSYFNIKDVTKADCGKCGDGGCAGGIAGKVSVSKDSNAFNINITNVENQGKIIADGGSFDNKTADIDWVEGSFVQRTKECSNGTKVGNNDATSYEKNVVNGGAGGNGGYAGAAIGKIEGTVNASIGSFINSGSVSANGGTGGNGANLTAEGATCGNGGSGGNAGCVGLIGSISGGSIAVNGVNINAGHLHAIGGNAGNGGQSAKGSGGNAGIIAGNGGNVGLVGECTEASTINIYNCSLIPRIIAHSGVIGEAGTGTTPGSKDTGNGTGSGGNIGFIGKGTNSTINFGNCFINCRGMSNSKTMAGHGGYFGGMIGLADGVTLAAQNFYNASSANVKNKAEMEDENGNVKKGKNGATGATVGYLKGSSNLNLDNCYYCIENIRDRIGESELEIDLTPNVKRLSRVFMCRKDFLELLNNIQGKEESGIAYGTWVSDKTPGRYPFPYISK